MKVHTRQVMAASCFEGNSAKPKTTIIGNTANYKAAIVASALRGEADEK